MRYQKAASFDAPVALGFKSPATLIDFARARPGYQPTDLAALTRDLAGAVRSQFERAGLTLIVDAQPLPALVNIDPGMWEKIVLNLLSNAFKFTAKGGAAIALDKDGDDVLLTVADTGAGIAEDQLPHIFEGGENGLVQVDKLAGLLKGDVQVQSEPGRGTVFSVRLPWAPIFSA